MSSRDGIATGGAHGLPGVGTQTAEAQALTRLDVDPRAFTFVNGRIGPVMQGHVEEPTGDSEEAVTLRTLIGLLRNAGVIS